MESIGYVEVIGLSNAVIVADHMLKAASVSIKHIENAYGGYITVSVTGDVAAVEAAIEAGVADSRVNVVSTNVLANPAEGVPELGETDVFTQPATPKPQPKPKQPVKSAKSTTTQAAKTSQPAAKATQVPAVKAKTTPATTKPKPTAKKPTSRRKTSRRPANKRSTTKPTQPKDKPES
ncbi:BMC domain-containing protein [Levilactobacillus angrenensis]|uniref:BMC domain-containing protein n=1 Tax=Levilactobacillus angrenensis TaxID=2486020 RepID=A0ABW1UB11_9LACO|nr:BMC domain-containing protein [Levilactobacillus angrenensis]